MTPLFLVVALPLLEIAVFVEVGDLIGTWPTIFLVLAAGSLGVALLRLQGRTVLTRLRQAAERGEPPEGAAFATACQAAAAVLLILPGFLSDVAAIVLLIPWARARLGRWLFRRFAGASGFTVWTTAPGGPRRSGRSDASGSEVIDGDFRRIDDEDTTNGAGSGDRPRVPGPPTVG